MSIAIQAIDQQSVHRICSGQVVLDLATAAKELVENSLDAGATAIDIRFKDYGVESLEIIDNGYGLRECDYETLALKHYTSKIQKFEDVEFVSTFGFRGEALSSLCALATLTVTTSTAAQTPTGVRLEYDANGRLESKSPVARATGTTVQLRNLFYTLPVRHREFKRNIKREFAKALNIIQAYCIRSNNVRISVSNQIGKGASSKVLTCNANKSIQDNLANLFGSKIMSQIIPLDLTLSDESITNEDDKIKVSGFISKPEWGNGRSSADRQYMYIAGRPCNMPKISRTLNEVYRSFVNQYPFAVVDIQLPYGDYDVNVSPDKRTIFIHHEKWITDRLSEALTKLLEPSRYTLPTNDLAVAPSSSEDALRQDNDSGESEGESDIISNSIEDVPPTQETIVVAVPALPATRKRPFKLSDMALNSGKMFMPANTEPDSTISSKRHYSQSTLDMVAVKQSRTMDIEEEPEEDDEDEGDNLQGSCSDVTEELPRKIQRVFEDAFNTSSCSGRSVENIPCPKHEENMVDEEEQQANSDSERATDWTPHDEQNSISHNDTQSIPASSRIYDASNVQSFSDKSSEADANDYTHEPPSPSVRYEEIISDQHITVSTERPYLGTCNLSTSIEMDATALLERFRHRLHKRHRSSPAKTTEKRAPLMNANISNTTDNGQATKALNRVIEKLDFVKMKVIGQFNLGFIIAALNDADLFIIDQHASDEKYNFETLQRTTQIKGQRLIQPRPIELTASEEMVAMENIDILRANGFDIEVNELAPPTQKIKIISQPISKNTMFNIKDFEELIFLLSDQPGEMVRCSKARAMFASRACRKSVMIGDSLGKSQMVKIVHHMSEIDQPWNCPHGRPTMRHLYDMRSSIIGNRSRGKAVQFPPSGTVPEGDSSY